MSETHAVKPVRNISGWSEWLKFWGEAQTATQLKGLLHEIFTFGDCPSVTPEKICFLLELAHEPDQSDSLPPDISKKARKILCQYFLNTNEKENDENFHLRLSTDPAVFQALLKFFDPKKGQGNIPFMDRFSKPSVETEKMHKFLLWFLEIIFLMRELGNPYTEEQRKKKEEVIKMLRSAWSQAIGIMNQLGVLYKLTRGRYAHLAKSKEVLRTLEDLAMTKSRNWKGDITRFASLEEAMCEGEWRNNESALALIVLRARRKQAARKLWEERADNRRQAEEARLVEIRRIEEIQKAAATRLRELKDS